MKNKKCHSVQVALRQSEQINGQQLSTLAHIQGKKEIPDNQSKKNQCKNPTQSHHLENEQKKMTENNNCQPESSLIHINFKISKWYIISVIISVLIGFLTLVMLMSAATSYVMLKQFKENIKNQNQNQHQNEREGIKVGQIAPLINTTSNPVPIDIFKEGWVDFQSPKFLYEFYYDTLDEIVISYKSIIPETTKAKYMKIMVLMKAGPEPSYSEYWTRLRVSNGKNMFVHWLQHVAHGSHFFCAGHNVILPVSDSRDFRIQAWVKRVNWMHAKIHVLGYYAGP